MKLKSAVAFLVALILIFCSFPIGVLAQTGKIYYVSVSGSDSNTGLSENAPLKTIAAVNNLALGSGAKVLFKRGDIWRGETLRTRPNVYYGAYGEGEKPAFYGSYENYAREDYWAISDTANVYESTFTLEEDIGAIVFENDSWVGVRYTTTENLTDLYKNGMFIVKKESENVNRIYVYNNSGNPGAVYNQMEFIQRSSLISGKGIDGVEANGITVEDICLKYGNYGYHINGTQKNVTLRRLDISFIGGRYISEENRGGNAIEFYGNSENVLVEDCRITQVYDTAFTCQMWGGKNRYFKNITLRNCDISYCHWTTEFWFRPYNENGEFATIENVDIIGNRFSYAGYGFGSEVRYLGNDTSKSTFMNAFVYDNYYNVDIEFSNNIFNGTKHYFFYSEFGKFTPKFSGNTYILTDDSMPGIVNGNLDTTKGDAVQKMAFEPDATVKRAHVIANRYTQTTKNAFLNSDFEDEFAEDSPSVNNWYCENASFSETDKISGQRALKVNGNSVTGNFTVLPETPYKLGFWYKGNAEVIVKDSNGNTLATTKTSNNKWDYYYLNFVTSEECRKLHITLSGNSLYDKILMGYYPEKQIISYHNGEIVLDGVFYTVGEKANFKVLPDDGYELEEPPVLAISDGTYTPSVYDKETGEVEFIAPDGNVYITCYFRKSGYIYGDNLLQNSGFDKNDNGAPWTIFWSASVTTAPYDYAYMLNKTGDACVNIANYSGGISQAFNVEKGKTYEITFLWAPNASNGNSTPMRVTVGDNYSSYSDKLKFDYNKIITSQGKGYEKFRDTFTATVTGTVYLRLERANYTTAVYVDDLAVREMTDINDLKAYPVRLDENIKNGSLSFNVNEAKSGDTVIVEALPEKFYALVKGTVTAFTDNEILELLPLDGTDKFYFIMPDSAVTVSVEFEFVNQGASGSVNILKDSACEKALGENWQQKWGSSVTVATSDYANSANKTGDSCIKIPNWQGGIDQPVNVVEGETYTLSFLWAPCASGGSKTSINIAVGDRYGDNPANYEFMLSETIESYNYSYQQYSKSFTATKTGTVYVRFDRRNCGTGTVALDDITLTTEYFLEPYSEEIFTDDQYIFGIKYGSSPDTVISSFNYDNCELRFDGDGEIKTGDTFTLYVSDVAVLSRTASVMGDCNSDGSMDILDFVALKKYCVRSREFSRAEILATRINGCIEGSAQSLCELKKLLIS